MITDKESAIKFNKKACGFFIEKKYPIYKQLNILRNGSLEEKEAMNEFINNMRNQSNTIEDGFNDILEFNEDIIEDIESKYMLYK